MAKALDSGKAFLTGVLAKLPESHRAQVEAAFAAPEAVDALTILGDGTLARSDYSRLMDDLRQQTTDLETQRTLVVQDHERLAEWWNSHNDYDGLKAEVDRLKAGGTPPVTPNTTPVVPPGLSREDVEKILSERDRGYASVLAVTTTLAGKHARDFNEVLDVQALINEAEKKRISLTEAYQQTFSEKLATKAKAEEDTRINQLVEARLAEERKAHPTMPYPIRGQQPSVLDILQPGGTDTPAKHSVDTAVDLYQQLVSQKAS